MKRFKKILAVALTLTVVCALMTIPASASKDVNYRATDSGDGSYFYWNTSLNVSGSTGSASVTVVVDTHGAFPADLYAGLEGHVYASYSQALRLYDNQETYGKTTITAVDSKTISGYDLIGAYCDFNPNFAEASTLTVGTVPANIQ